jgi:hypothetical protein
MHVYIKVYTTIPTCREFFDNRNDFGGHVRLGQLRNELSKRLDCRVAYLQVGRGGTGEDYEDVTTVLHI